MLVMAQLIFVVVSSFDGLDMFVAEPNAGNRLPSMIIAFIHETHCILTRDAYCTFFRREGSDCE